MTPLLKIDVPKGKIDYRGINVTPVIARAFEKSVYKIHARDTVEHHLSLTQFAYRKGGAVLTRIQHTVYSYLDDPERKAVRSFALDFSTAFDSVNHELLSYELKDIPLNPFIINWYLSFLENRQQCIVNNSFQGQWKCVNRGTTKGSVRGPHLFSVFINDLEISIHSHPVLFKHADDSTLIDPVLSNGHCRTDLVDQFLIWSKENSMICNSPKCKEIIFRKKVLFRILRKLITFRNARSYRLRSHGYTKLHGQML